MRRQRQEAFSETLPDKLPYHKPAVLGSDYSEPDLRSYDREHYRADFRYKLHREMREMYDLQQVEHGLTYKEIAERLGVNPSVITMRFKGRSNLTLNALSDTFRAMGARLDVKGIRIEDLRARERAVDVRGVAKVTMLLSGPDEREQMRLEFSMDGAGAFEWSGPTQSEVIIGREWSYADLEAEPFGLDDRFDSRSLGPFLEFDEQSEDGRVSGGSTIDPGL